jgi:hypothetical protein
LLIREHCFLRALSMTAQPKTRFFSFALKLNSASETGLTPCAESRTWRPPAPCEA